jgi:hypothetical protein
MEKEREVATNHPVEIEKKVRKHLLKDLKKCQANCLKLRSLTLSSLVPRPSLSLTLLFNKKPSVNLDKRNLKAVSKLSRITLQ